MKLFLYHLLIVSRISQLFADNAGDCNIKGITSYYWRNGYVNNDLISDNSLSVNILGSAEKLVLMKTLGDYLTAIDTGYNSVQIQTNNLWELDRNTGTTPGEITAISADFTFNCKSGNSTLTYMVVVRDYNHHSPHFDYDYYEYKIPKTLEPNEDITAYGPEIIVTDLDFSNKRVDFEMMHSDLFVCKTENLGNKRYKAFITIKNITEIDEGKLYTLKSTDYGNYPSALTANTTLRIFFSNDANTMTIRNFITLFVIVVLFIN